MSLTKPSPEEGEITLIGTGGGYGESIVIHLGRNYWVIVDSCINPNTKKSLPLEYLESINVDPEEAVKLIICTHWHDDHILGMSTVLNQCVNAKFCCAEQTDLKKFLQLVYLDYDKASIETSNSSTIEFAKCLEIVKERKTVFKLAQVDKILLTEFINNEITSQVISLSPSDYTCLNFANEISTLITNYGESSKKIMIQSPNAKSVALFVKLGYHNILLGADLEVSANNNEGWFHILDHSQFIKGNSFSLFKLPHHGSENGYSERVWKELISEQAVAKLTPWKKNKGLPTDKMLSTYKNHTNLLYTTSVSDNKSKSKKRANNIERILKKLDYNLQEVKFEKGIIQSRINITDINSKWQTTLFDAAKKVT